jgi:hypothetical protein
VLTNEQLRNIIADPATTEEERKAAQTVLYELSAPTQLQEDCLIERWLTGQRDREDHRYVDELRTLCMAITASRLLWIFAKNLTDLPLLIALHGRTRSDLVRSRTFDAITHIARNSPIEDAKLTAQQYLNQLRTNQNEQPEK